MIDLKFVNNVLTFKLGSYVQLVPLPLSCHSTAHPHSPKAIPRDRSTARRGCGAGGGGQKQDELMSTGGSPALEEVLPAIATVWASRTVTLSFLMHLRIDV